MHTSTGSCKPGSPDFGYRPSTLTCLRMGGMTWPVCKAGLAFLLARSETILTRTAAQCIVCTAHVQACVCVCVCIRVWVAPRVRAWEHYGCVCWHFSWPVRTRLHAAPTVPSWTGEPCSTLVVTQSRACGAQMRACVYVCVCVHASDCESVCACSARVLLCALIFPGT